MTQSSPTTEQPKAGWRFRIGAFLFIVGLVCPVFIPLITASNLPTTWKTTLSGALVLGIPQVFSLTAVAFMGKAGFNYLKAKLFGLLKKLAPSSEVSRIRYRIGLVLFVMPLLYGWLSPYLADYIPGYDENSMTFSVVGDCLLLVSLVVLGGEFWEKIRALFLYRARVQT